MRPVTPGAALFFFSLVGFASGIGLAQFRVADSIGTAFGSALLSFIMFAWFCDDSWRRCYKRSAVLNTAFVSLTIIVLPYYLIKSRGVKKGVLATGGAMGIFLAYPVSAGLGMLASRYVHA
jgi:hypothetical protein